jgi:hypothetical protein
MKQDANALRVLLNFAPEPDFSPPFPLGMGKSTVEGTYVPSGLHREQLLRRAGFCLKEEKEMRKENFI